MPRLDHTQVHRDDLPALVTARNAAESVQKHIVGSRKEISPAVRADVLTNVARLLSAVYTLGAKIRDGREFLDKHGPDGVSREKAELEMQLLGASVPEIREIKAAMKRLDERAARSADVARAVATLRARMISAGSELNALDARLGAVLGTEALGFEIQAYQQSVDLALDDFQRTWGEVDRLE